MSTEDPEADNPADKARLLIREAFAEINRLPHGTEEDAAGLIEAQSHLAQARRALDAWQDRTGWPEARAALGRPTVHHSHLPPDHPARVRVEDLLKRLEESEEHLEKMLGNGESP